MFKTSTLVPLYHLFSKYSQCAEGATRQKSVITQRNSPKGSPHSLNRQSHKGSFKNQPYHSSRTMNQQPAVSPIASGGNLLLNLTQMVFEQRQLLQLSRRKEEEVYFVDYIPPARDAITLPRNVAYVLVGVVLVIVATYAIVGHLIKDLMHDLADYIFGPKPVEDDLERGSAEIEEERRLSVSSKLMKEDGLRMEKEKDRPLPGFHRGDGACHHPSSPPPLRSAIASAFHGEKRMSAHSVTFVCPASPYVTSL